MTLLSDGFRVLRSSSTVSGTDDGEGSVAVHCGNPVRACKSCFSGSWRTISGCLRYVINCSPPINICRAGYKSEAYRIGQQQEVSARLFEVVENSGSYNKEQSNAFQAKEQLVLISKLSSLFSGEDQRRINELNSEIPAAEANYFKEDGASTSDVDHREAADYVNNVEDLKEKLEKVLDNIPQSKKAEKSAENYSPATLKDLSGYLDSCSLEGLKGLCETIKIPDDLITLFNSKLLKAQLTQFIKNGENGLFRIPGIKSDVDKFINLFNKELLTKVKDGKGGAILNKSPVLASAVKHLLHHKYPLTGTKKEMHEEGLGPLTKLVDQVLYVDTLDIIHYQCKAAKEVSEQQAGAGKVLSLSGFAAIIGPGFFGDKDVRAVRQTVKVNSEEEIHEQKQQMEQLQNSWVKSLETFINAWPEEKNKWEGKQNLSKATLPAQEKTGQATATASRISTVLSSGSPDF